MGLIESDTDPLWAGIQRAEDDPHIDASWHFEKFIMESVVSETSAHEYARDLGNGYDPEPDTWVQALIDGDPSYASAAVIGAEDGKGDLISGEIESIFLDDDE